MLDIEDVSALQVDTLKHLILKLVMNIKRIAAVISWSLIMALATPVTASSTNEVNAQCATLKASHLTAQYQVNNANKGQRWQMTRLRVI